ncbi:MAG: GAF domain-containing protein [Bacteroidia bacterium]
MSENISIPSGLTKKETYQSLLPQLNALVEGEKDTIANLANVIAALKEAFGFFWIGFYFVKSSGDKEELVLGPFQGPVACTRIGLGKGVCGACWSRKETILVPDVDQFPGHIACSSLSRSEIVVPVFVNGKVAGVLDVDSDQLAHFDAQDAEGLEDVAALISGIL